MIYYRYGNWQKPVVQRAVMMPIPYKTTFNYPLRLYYPRPTYSNTYLNRNNNLRPRIQNQISAWYLPKRYYVNLNRPHQGGKYF